VNAEAVKQVATDLASESKDKAKRIAHDLFGDVPYGAEQLSKREFLDMLRRNWQDPQYRAALGGYFDPQGLYHAGRISPQAFLDAALEAGLIPPWQDAAMQLEASNGAG
jgi:hypothetical protein